MVPRRASTPGPNTVHVASTASWQTANSGKVEEEAASTAAAQEMVVGAAGDRVPHLDVVEAVAALLQAPRAMAGAGFVPCLEAHEQGTENRCAAAAITTGMYLRALLLASPGVRVQLQNARHVPSACHAYHVQRRMECEANRRCLCGPVCGGLCNNCGTVLSVMVEACQAGVVTCGEWPASKFNSLQLVQACKKPEYLETRCYYSLPADGVVWLKATAGAAALVSRIRDHLADGQPVLITCIHYRSQLPFFERLSGAGQGVSVYDNAFTLPGKKDGERPHGLGHAMLIVGLDEKLQRLRVRNSRGPKWGFHGDFNMPTRMLTPVYVSSLLAVRDVQLHNLEHLTGSTK